MESRFRLENERFTAEEAGEILKRAAAMRSDFYTLKDMEAIAQEVGIPPEVVHEAAAEYLEEQQRLKAQEAQYQAQYNADQKVAAVFLWFMLAIFALILFLAFTQSTHSNHASQRLSPSPLSDDDRVRVQAEREQR